MKRSLKLLLLLSLFNTLFCPQIQARDFHTHELLTMLQPESHKTHIVVGYVVPYFGLPDLNLPYARVLWGKEDWNFSAGMLHRSPAGLSQSRIQAASSFYVTEQLRCVVQATTLHYASPSKDFTMGSMSFAMQYDVDRKQRLTFMSAHLLQLGDELSWLVDEQAGFAVHYSANIAKQLECSAAIRYGADSGTQLYGEASFVPVPLLQCRIGISTHPLQAFVAIGMDVVSDIRIDCSYRSHTIGSGVTVGATFEIGD